MQHQIITMLEMQDAMNVKVHEDWKSQDFQWYRAVWVECAELMDHYGWKWWKKQNFDRDQVVLEMIDIWHFGLSMLLISESDNAVLAERVASGVSIEPKPTDFRSNLEVFTAEVLNKREFNVSLFAQMMVDIDLSFNQLYVNYVGKNVLNFFRQDHGYKEGTYVKQWNGLEDNEHLVDILAKLDINSEVFKDDVYAALESRYPTP